MTGILIDVLTKFPQAHDKKLADFATDASIFVSTFRNAISQSTHTYICLRYHLHQLNRSLQGIFSLNITKYYQSTLGNWSIGLWLRAFSKATQMVSFLLPTRLMASGSSQALWTRQCVCGMQRQVRWLQGQIGRAQSGDIVLPTRLMASGSSQALGTRQCVCGMQRQVRWLQGQIRRAERRASA